MAVPVPECAMVSAAAAAQGDPASMVPMTSTPAGTGFGAAPVTTAVLDIMAITVMPVTMVSAVPTTSAVLRFRAAWAAAAVAVAAAVGPAGAAAAGAAGRGPATPPNPAFAAHLLAAT